jgi:hypothetical protein
MSLPLVVNGQTYNYPENRDSPSWGEEATAWASAVTSLLANVTGSGDIAPTSANIANNQSSVANVIGLSFDTSTVRGAIVEYSVYRNSTLAGATELVETGTMYLGYKSVAATWEIAIVGSAGAGTTFSITNTGQVQYTSTNMTGSAYAGVIKFRARAIT